MRRSKSPGWLIAAIVGVLFACGDMRQDELDCEEAVSHLQSCCPGFDSSAIQCTYSSGCGTTQYPAIATPQSQCIRGEDCSTLVASGVCKRAQHVWPVVVNEAGSDPDSSPDVVCP